MKRRITGLLLLLLLVPGLMACGKKEEEQEKGGGETVFYVGNEAVNLPEVYVYAKIVTEHYENAYGQGVWTMALEGDEGESRTLEDVTREDIINSILQVKLLRMEAEDRSVTLTDEEEQEVETETQRFWRYMTDEEMECSDVTEALVSRVMKENLLAGKMYEKTLEEADLSVSDEEARQTRFFDLFFPASKVEADGTVTAFSDEEAEAVHQNALEAYNSLLNPAEGGGTDVHISDMENLKRTWQLSLADEVVMTPEEIRGTYGEDIREMLYQLEDGSYSLVTESAYGWHIFYMIALTDREATDARKEDILKEKRQAAFEAEKSRLLEKYSPGFRYENSVNMDVYNRIEFGGEK